MMRNSYIYIMVMTMLFGASCINRADKQNSSRDEAVEQSVEASTREFPYVAVPSHIAPQHRGEYVKAHFWDRFDFADTLSLTRVDSTALLKAYATWIQSCVGRQDGESVRGLMQRAAVSRTMLDRFASMSEALLHDPNSPFRSDELYIAALEVLLGSPYYDEYERMAPQYDLEMASQNRIGHKANDFRYTLASGRSGSLYGLKCDFVLLYINTPGCPMCRDIQADLLASPIVERFIKSGKLKILAIYPDRDLAEWRRHPLPKGWINGYDKGCVIERDRLYDLRAIPSMYLLDARKVVMVKDSSDVADIEYFLRSVILE
ncbi:MAG: DUF5106 domain-containing protein [Alistipes sp.]|nr:DUF5106 domain-containing protein [Alistipes sp.]